MTRPLDTPWMTVKEACEYARCGRAELLTALRTEALRGSQTKANGKWRIHRLDVDAWLDGVPPFRTVPAITRGRAS